jgi:DNA-binding protein
VRLLVRVKKRGGFLQEFDKKKLEVSLKKAGAREKQALKVAEKVTSRLEEGITTGKIKWLAATELRKCNEETAQTYMRGMDVTEPIYLVRYE